MKRLTNTKIVYQTSTWSEWEHCYHTDDYASSYSESKTMDELFSDAQSTLSECTYGIARIFYGKYQIGTVTKRCFTDVTTYYTNFGKKLSGN